jgi:cyclophilin family peptidyl-prolyl cis-trans isomerase/HEAT repeat protein
MTSHRLSLSVAAILLLAGCASAPPAAPPVPPVTYEQKLGWILHLEDARILRDPAPVVLAPAPPVSGRRGAAAVSPAPVYASLLDLLVDRDPRLRRRAAIAVGRVGLAEGVEPLLGRIEDPDPDVRTMVCFALGLLGDRRAADALARTLGGDANWHVRGRAADALGRIGDAAHAPAIAQLARMVIDSGSLGAIADDDLGYPLAADVEAFRLALYALVRLKAYDPLASAVLDGQGQPRSRWWPVAYALQRIEDPRAVPALIALAASPGADTAAFAARGLGMTKDPRGVEALLRLADPAARPARVVAAAVRALGQIGDPRAGPALVALARQGALDDNARLEVITALGLVGGRPALEAILDQVPAQWAPVRAAAFRALAAVDAESFFTVMSALDNDREWSVRAEQAAVFGGLDPQRALPAIRLRLADADPRVRAAALSALAAVNAPDVLDRVRGALEAEPEVLRTTAIGLVAKLRPSDGAALLRAAYERGRRDAGYDARAAALDALAAFGADAARGPLRDALADPEWAVRRKALDLLARVDPSADMAAARPAPTGRAREAYGAQDLVAPRYSPVAYVDTSRGAIQIELDVINAPLTTANFIALARRGFFNGVVFHRVVPNFVVQAGDPGGDGEGGPGYAIRDELSDAPYLRGTVGMALSWPDTAGSQFFITHGPQPHLDGRYAVFGRVASGMEVVDEIRRWDVIERVRIWDGIELR